MNLFSSIQFSLGAFSSGAFSSGVSPPTRGGWIGLWLVFGLLWGNASPAHAVIADTLEAMQEKSLGAAEAPVTLIEYASLTCGHCGNFHNEIVPTLQKNYIDTGKLRLIYRDFPLDGYALKASMLARCRGEKGFFPFIKVLYQRQMKWIQADDPLIALARIARLSGMSGEEFRQCIGNRGIEKALLQARLDASKEYKIKSTPTIIIDDEKYDGPLTIEAISEAIDRRLDE